MIIKKLYLLGKTKAFKTLEKKIHKVALLYTLFFSSLYANSPYIDDIAIQDDQSVWLALFGLALVGVFTLFLSSDQVKNLIRKYEEMIRVQTELAQKQQKMLEFVGEKIETSTKGIIRHREVLTNNSFRTMDKKQFNEELKLFKETESVLLDATHELVDFLKIKSGRLEVIEEQFKLSNMLSEVFGFVSSKTKKHKIEMLYNVDTNVSTELTGDSKRLEQILSTLASEIIEDIDNSILSLSVIKVDKCDLLRFTLSNKDKIMSQKEIAELFTGELLGESSFSKKKMDLYIVNEIVKQMRGTIEVTSSSKNGTQFNITLPYKVNRHITLPSAKIKDKKILVFEKTIESSETIAKILMYHNTNVDYCSKDNLHTYLSSLCEYDILFIDNSLFSNTLLDKIGKETKGKKPYVVVLKNSFDTDVSQAYKVDAKLYRPLQSENFLNLLNTITKDTMQIDGLNNIKPIVPLAERKGMSREAFKDFSYAHILIVEDNYINQKILKSLLGTSGMKLTIVSSGREALKVVKSNGELDMVLMDSNMPMMDGYETTKEIRKIYSKKQLPVIMIIGEGFKNDIDKISKAGANTFLHKPFIIGTLYSAFETFLTKESSKIKDINSKLSKYTGNKDVLDTKKGITKAHSAIFYKELLSEVLIVLKDSDLKIEKMVQKQDMINLQKFILKNIHLCERVGAKRLLAVLKEMNMLFIYKEETRLKEYINIYKKALNGLSKEAKSYLKSATL